MRHSRPQTTTSSESHKLFSSPEQKADLEARNGLFQFDEVVRLIHTSNDVLALSPDIIKSLHSCAIRDIYSCAGNFRNGWVTIHNSSHTPPHPDQVSVLVDSMCEYANDHQKDAVHVSAYLMWRMNWIHPFFGGNGRTSRAVSYLALSVGLGMLLPGNPTIPDQIVLDREPYYEALEAADHCWGQGQLNLELMEGLIRKLLTQQLSSGHGP